jgi:hypothetical protein
MIFLVLGLYPNLSLVQVILFLAGSLASFNIIIQLLRASGQYLEVWMNEVPKVNCLFLKARSYDMHIISTIG